MKHNRVIYLSGIISLAVILIMLLFSSPTEIGPFGVLLFFTTIYIISFDAVVLLFKMYKKIALKKNRFTNKDYLYSAVFAFSSIMLLMAPSFGAINLWTVGLIIIFIALSEFLVYKRI